MTTLEEKIDIAVDEDNIAGTFVTPGTLIPGVLFVHGWGGSQQQYLARARELAALGCVCMTFDLRGHADTKPLYEKVSRAANLRDVLAAYDKLVTRRHVDPSAIAVVGSSYGGYLATILTTMRPVKWLALRAPALYIDTGWEMPKVQLQDAQDLRNYRRQIVPVAENRALQACADFEGDVLLIQSELDDIVPKAVLQSYSEAAKSAHSLTYRCIPGADHGLTSDSDQRAYSKMLVGWLKEMIFGARAGALQPPSADASAAPETPPHSISAH